MIGNLKDRATIKDIAARGGVSISTVHLVLAGKPGPKEETRAQILKLAGAMNYACNSAASSLKRGTTRIAAVLPSLSNDNMFYYAPVWGGIRAQCEEVRDFNIELVEVPYINRDLVAVPAEAIERVREERGIAGLIVLGDIEPEAKKLLRAMSSQKMPIVLVNSDAPEVGRICCVQSENYLLGRVMGEILHDHTPRGSGILICAGERNTPANAESTRGIEDYLNEHDAGRDVYKIHFGNDMDGLHREIIRHFHEYKGIAGCCSVTARGSVQLSRALSDAGLAGTVTAIGSDVFEENIESLKAGIFKNLIFKNPYRQGWLAAEKLFNHTIRNQRLDRDMFLVKGEVVFRSSVSMYE